MSSRLSLPIATAILTAISLFAAGTPELSALLQLDWEAVGGGQRWRLWTGHLVHWTTEHLFWDALTFFALGALCERTHRRAYLVALGVGLPAISWGLAILRPEIATYRGLSGIDTGLFVWLILLQLRRSGEARQTGLTALWTLLLTGLIGKLVYEAVTGDCLFVSTSPESFRPLVESHLLGAAVGALAFAGSGAGGVIFFAFRRGVR